MTIATTQQGNNNEFAPELFELRKVLSRIAFGNDIFDNTSISTNSMIGQLITLNANVTDLDTNTQTSISTAVDRANTAMVGANDGSASDNLQKSIEDSITTATNRTNTAMVGANDGDATTNLLASIEKMIESIFKIVAGVDGYASYSDLQTLNDEDRNAILTTLAPSILRTILDRSSNWNTDQDHVWQQADDGGEIARAIKEMSVSNAYESQKSSALINAVREYLQQPFEERIKGFSFPDLATGIDTNIKSARTKAISDQVYQINQKDANATNNAADNGYPVNVGD